MMTGPSWTTTCGAGTRASRRFDRATALRAVHALQMQAFETFGHGTPATDRGALCAGPARAAGARICSGTA